MRIEWKKERAGKRLIKWIHKRKKWRKEKNGIATIEKKHTHAVTTPYMYKTGAIETERHSNPHIKWQ